MQVAELLVARGAHPELRPHHLVRDGVRRVGVAGVGHGQQPLARVVDAVERLVDAPANRSATSTRAEASTSSLLAK